MLRPVDFLSELELANHDAGVDFLTVREPPNCHYGVERADPYDEVVQPVLIHERGRGEVICVAFTFWFVLRPLAMLANQIGFHARVRVRSFENVGQLVKGA